MSCLVHGDDFTLVGPEAGPKHIEGRMKEWYELKVKAVLRPGPEDCKEVEVLSRIVRCTAEGYEYEADPKHRTKVMEALGFDDRSKGLTVSGRVENESEESVELVGPAATQFKAVAARLNYLAHAAKEVCREMAGPTERSWQRLKVLARFLLERLAVVWKYSWQEDCQELVIYSDSDWDGRRRTRRSTSGGVVTIGCHCLKTWSSTQAR
jgi:hypothetical protein